MQNDSMTDDEKLKYLIKKGFKSGDVVRFHLDKKSAWKGDNQGIIILSDKPYIEKKYNNIRIRIPIDEECGAYLWSIKHV